MPVSHFESDIDNKVEAECQTECDIDSIYTLDGFKTYFDTGIAKLRAEMEESLKTLHTDTLLDHPLVKRQTAEITFLRTELGRRHQEFSEREASMQTVINILSGEQQTKSTRSSQNHHSHLFQVTVSMRFQPRKTIVNSLPSTSR